MAKSSSHSLLRVTALSAALMGIYGVAHAVPDIPPTITLVCNASGCNPADPVDGTNYYSASEDGQNKWVVKAEGASTNVTLNGGSVTAHGSKNRAVGAHSGSTVSLNNVGVTTDARVGNSGGWGGHGVQAHGAGSVVNVNNSTVTASGASYSLGLQAQKGGLVTGSGNTISTSGTNSFGVEADSGGHVNISNSTITTSGATAAGARALTGSGETERGRVTLTNTNVTTTGAGAVGLMAGDEDGAGQPYSAGDITFNGGTVKAAGSAARVRAGSSLMVNGARLESATSHGVDVSSASATLTSTDIVVSHNAVNPGDVAGVLAQDGGTASLTGGSVTATGSKSRGILATTASSVTTNGTNVTTSGDGSHAVHAWGNQTANTTTVNLTGGTLTTSGKESYGVSAQNAGKVVANGTRIVTSNEAGFGAFAYNAGEVEINNGSINTSGPAFDHPSFADDVGAFGVLAKRGSTITLDNTSIVTSGALAEGVRAEHETSGTTRVILKNGSTVATSGANAHGVGVYGATGSSSDATSVTMTGGSVKTTGAGAAGVFLKGNASAELNGVTVESAGASIVSNLTRHSEVQTITVNGASYLQKNDGTLLKVVRASGEDGARITLTLNEGAYASGNIVNYVEGGDGVVTNNNTVFNNNGNWAGIVVKADTTVVDAGATQTVSGTVAGDVSGSQGSTVVLGSGASVGGSLASGVNATVTSNGPVSIVGSVLGQPGSTVAFTGPSTIGTGLVGVSSVFNFAGNTTISSGGVAASGGSLVFSGASTSITGNLQLDDSATLRGGTAGAPIQVTGNAVVNSGATLGGNLNVSGALSGSGGTLGPGNSVGVQTYGSMAGFTGTYVAEVNAAGASDLIRISTGNVDLSGIDLQVRQEDGKGGYKLNHDYTIVEAVAGTIDGAADATKRFKSETLDSSFDGTLVKLNATKYGSKDVKVSLSADDAKVAAKRPGLSANQNATLDGVLSVAGQNASADAALQSTDTAGAMNQLSGEVHGSTQSALLSGASVITKTLSNRMRGNLGAGMSAGAPVAQSSGSLPAGAMPTSNARPLWAEVVGNWGSLEDNGNAAKVSTRTTGLFVGGDGAVGNGWRVGAAFGFTDGKIEVNDRSSKSDVNSYTAALYGGNSWATGEGKVNFLAGAAYTRHDVDSRRHVTVGGNQTLKADYHVNTTQLFTELGYAMPVGQASEVEPYLGVAWLNQRAKGFAESGGSAALSSDSQTDDVTMFTLGLRGKTTIEAGKNTATLFAGLGWRHAAGDVESSRSMRFIQGNGASFKVAGSPIAKNAALVDLGAEMAIGKQAAMGLSYNGQFGNGNTENTGSLYLRVKF